MSEERGATDLDALEARARLAMPRGVFDFVDGGFNDEVTYRRTRRVFDSIGLVPRRLVDVSHVDTSTAVLGQGIALPVLAAPSAPQIAAHPEGDLATCRAAGAEGTIEILSHNADFTVEEVAAVATGPVWCNLFLYKDREHVRQYVERAEAAGCAALVWTVDMPCLDMMKERTARHPDPIVARSQRWANLVRREPGGGEVVLDFEEQLDPSATWDDMAWLRARTSLPIVVKGILRGDDARRCVEHGAAGIVVSNHGARLIDGTIPAIEALPEVVDAVAGRCEVLMDDGIRRGTDILKALALGARAVLIGRPIWYGLAAGGEAGVRRTFAILRRELARAMATCGVARTADLDRGLLAKPPTLREAGGSAATRTTA